jgi:hypothetical protein
VKVCRTSHPCRPSALRKLHDSIADPKYDGKRTTRQQLLESDEGNSELESEDNLSDEEASGSHPSINEDEDEDLPSQSNLEEDGSKADEAGDISRRSPSKDSEAPEDLSSALQKTREEDRKKGKAVSRQIVRSLASLIYAVVKTNICRLSGTHSLMLAYVSKNPPLLQTGYLP